MDFTVWLPKSEGYTKIWVIVDRFSKMTHFIPFKTEEHIMELALIFWRKSGAFMGSQKELSLTEIPGSHPSFG